MKLTPARIDRDPQGGIHLSGHWTVAGIAEAGQALRHALLKVDHRSPWSCIEVEAMDSAAAVLLWRAWGGRRPDQLEARAEQLHLFEHLEKLSFQRPVLAPEAPSGWAKLGRSVWRQAETLKRFVEMLGQLVLDGLHVLRHPAEIPWREFSANLYKTGFLALPIISLVGFLIGIVLSYLFSLQLKQLGADALIVNVLGLGIIREVGPVLTAVLVAGRSGSAMTAQMGVMRVTEEIDALAAMGVPVSLRIIFPKVLALAITLPLLVAWASAVALLGGMLSAWLQLDISHDLFFDLLPKVVPIANLWISLGKGVAFGIAVALVACHFGLRVKPNTESLSANTTASVVVSITAVILIDAIFAMATRGIGVPKL